MSKRQARPLRLRSSDLTMFRTQVRSSFAPRTRKRQEASQRPSSQRARRMLEDTKARCPLDDLFSQIKAGNCQRTADHRQSRCTGFCRGSKTESCKALQRGSCRQSHPRRCWCDQRVRRYAGIRSPMRSLSDLTYVRMRQQSPSQTARR